MDTNILYLESRIFTNKLILYENQQNNQYISLRHIYDTECAQSCLCGFVRRIVGVCYWVCIPPNDLFYQGEYLEIS